MPRLNNLAIRVVASRTTAAAASLALTLPPPGPSGGPAATPAWRKMQQGRLKQAFTTARRGTDLEVAGARPFHTQVDNNEVLKDGKLSIKPA